MALWKIVIVWFDMRRLVNSGEETVTVNRLMSMQLDMEAGSLEDYRFPWRLGKRDG